MQLNGGSEYDLLEVGNILMLTKSKVYCDRNVDNGNITRQIFNRKSIRLVVFSQFDN